MEDKSIWDFIPIINAYRERNSLREKVKRLEIRSMSAQKQIADKEGEIAGLEKKIEKFRKDFATFEKFKQFCIRDYAALKAKYESLDKKRKSAGEASKTRANGLIKIARTYKYGANAFAMNSIARSLEDSGISALVLNEQELIEYATPHVYKKIGVKKLVGCYFNDVFQEGSITNFRALGPRHPLTTKESKEFAGILFNFEMGPDPETKNTRQYNAIWLVDEKKRDLMSYLRGGHKIAMPQKITMECKKAVGDLLNACVGQKRRNIVLDCIDSDDVDPEFARYLAEVSRSFSGNIYVSYPSKPVYNAFVAAGFPKEYVTNQPKDNPDNSDCHVFGLNLGFNPA